MSMDANGELEWRLAALKMPESEGNSHQLRLSLSDLDTASVTSSSLSPSSFAGSGLEKLAMTAQAAKKKHLQRLQLMKSQTYRNADIVHQRQEKDRADEAHSQTVEARQQQLKAERLAREAAVEARRKEIAEEEKRRTEALKEHLTIKVGSSEQKAQAILQQRAEQAEEARVRRAMEVHARRETLLRKNLQLMEERQANLARKEAAADAATERVAKQKAIAEAEARAKFLQAESDRLMALEAAEQEYNARYEYFQAKVEAKEDFMERKREEQAMLKEARAEEARMRDELARKRLEIKNKNDELNQQELMRKVAEKNEKTQAIEEQRLAIQAELSATLREIAASDAWLKERAAKMKQEGEYRVDPDLEEMERKCTAELERMLAAGSPTRGSPTRSGASTPGRSPLRQSLNGALGRPRRSPHASPLAKSAQFSAGELHREEH